MTFGAGGHTRGILDRLENSIVYAIDRDETAIELAHQMAKEYPCERKKKHKFVIDIFFYFFQIIEIDCFHFMDNLLI